MQRTLRILICSIAALLFWERSFAVDRPGEELKEVVPATALGVTLDPKIKLITSEGLSTELGTLLAPRKPLILVPAYFTCPRLCGLVLDGVAKLSNEINFDLGQEYSIATFSFDSSDTPKEALAREKEVRPKLTRPGGDPNAWRYFTSDQENINKFLTQLGFSVEREGKDFAHSAAIYIVTPEGVISQYFTGIEFPAWDVRLALIEASQGGIGSMIDHVLLFCFRYDPLQGRYLWAVTALLRIVGTLTIVSLLLLFIWLWRRDASRGTMLLPDPPRR